MTGDAEPQSRLTRDRAAGMLLVVMALVIAWQSHVLPLGTLARPGPAFAPDLTAGLLALLGLWLAVVGGGPPLRALRWPEARLAVLLLGATALATVALEPLGYCTSMFLLVAILLAFVERRGLVPSLLAAAALAGGSFYLFAVLLRVPLPRGPLGF